MKEQELSKRSIDTIRALAMDAVQKANAGHPGTAMALAPLAYLLYTEVMDHNPADPAWPDRDRFVLSAGHAVRCSSTRLLHLTRLQPLARGAEALPPVAARTRRAIPSTSYTPGVETTTGPLGQGFANGVGMAIAERFLADTLQPARARDRRPPRLRDLLRRRHDGGRLQRGRLDRRPPRARQARLLLRRQPHHDRRHDVALVRRRERRQALRGAGLARPVGRRLRGRRRAPRPRSQAAKDEVERPSLIVVRSHIAYPAPHAVDTAKSHGSPLGEEEVRGDQGGARLRPGRSTSTSTARSTST